MVDEQLPQSNSQTPKINQQHKNILEQTYGEILKSNPQAQNIIMKSMGIDQQKFQEMLNSAEGNPIMNQKISDLFKSGFFQKAQNAQQMTPEQMQEMMNTIPQGPSQVPKKSFFEKLKGIFKGD